MPPDLPDSALSQEASQDALPAGGTPLWRRARRVAWVSAGVLCVTLGLIGIPLPLLPTTPFMLLAAFCFARGSTRLHRWLVTHPRLGPPILEWQQHGAISRGGKRAAVIAMAAVFGIACLWGLPAYALALQGVVLLCVATFLLTRPDPPSKSQTSNRG